MRIYSPLITGVILVFFNFFHCLGRPIPYEVDVILYPRINAYQMPLTMDDGSIQWQKYQEISPYSQEVKPFQFYDKCYYSVTYVTNPITLTVKQPGEIFDSAGVSLGTLSRSLKVTGKEVFGTLTLLTPHCPEPSTYASVFGVILLGFGSYRKWIRNR